MKTTRCRFLGGITLEYDMRHYAGGEMRCDCPVCETEVDPNGNEFLTYPYCEPCYEKAFGPLRNNEPRR